MVRMRRKPSGRTFVSVRTPKAGRFQILQSPKFMYTPTNGESPDSQQLANYGLLVQDLLSQCGTKEWIDDLWSIYTGYSIYQKEVGYNPRLSETFTTFKELVFFFQKLEKMK